MDGHDSFKYQTSNLYTEKNLPDLIKGHDPIPSKCVYLSESWPRLIDKREAVICNDDCVTCVPAAAQQEPSK